jgi:hypothetical protein
MISNDPKDWTLKAMTADALLSKVPVFVKGVCMQASSSGNATVAIYNGVDTSGEKLMAVHSQQYGQCGKEYEIPVYFNRGLYIDIGNNVALFTIQYQEEGKR